MIDKTINLLGLEATDKITGITGVVDSVCFDLYGCVQVSLARKANKDGTIPDGRWFDVNRVDFGSKRTLPVPAFESRTGEPAGYDRGPAHKAPPRN